MMIKRMTKLNNSRRCIKSKITNGWKIAHQRENNKITIGRTVIVGTDIRSLF